MKKLEYLKIYERTEGKRDVHFRWLQMEDPTIVE